MLALVEKTTERVPEPRVRIVRSTREQHASGVVDDECGDGGRRLRVVNEPALLALDATLSYGQFRRTARAVAPTGQDAHRGTVLRVSPRHVPASVTELARVGLLQSLPGETLAKLADRMEREDVGSGTVLVREGDPGDRFYVLLAGVAGVSQQSMGERRILRAGEFFGEVALVMNVPRTATVTAMTPCVVASCDQAAFDELLRPLFAEDGEPGQAEA